jgi:hypothetical protein
LDKKPLYINNQIDAKLFQAHDGKIINTKITHKWSSFSSNIDELIIISIDKPSSYDRQAKEVTFIEKVENKMTKLLVIYFELLTINLGAT